MTHAEVPFEHPETGDGAGRDVQQQNPVMFGFSRPLHPTLAPQDEHVMDLSDDDYDMDGLLSTPPPRVGDVGEGPHPFIPGSAEHVQEPHLPDRVVDAEGALTVYTPTRWIKKEEDHNRHLPPGQTLGPLADAIQARDALIHHRAHAAQTQALLPMDVPRPIKEEHPALPLQPQNALEGPAVLQNLPLRPASADNMPWVVPPPPRVRVHPAPMSELAPVNGHGDDMHGALCETRNQVSQLLAWQTHMMKQQEKLEKRIRVEREQVRRVRQEMARIAALKDREIMELRAELQMKEAQALQTIERLKRTAWTIHDETKEARERRMGDRGHDG